MPEAWTPDEPDLAVPAWVPEWADDVLYRAYDVERFGDTWHQRIVGYVRYLEGMAYEPAVALGRAIEERDAYESQSGAWQAEAMELRAEVARLKECTHCYEPGCPNYNGPAGWDRREQYS